MSGAISPGRKVCSRRAHAAGHDGLDVLHFLGYLVRGRDHLVDSCYRQSLARSPTDATLHYDPAEVGCAQRRDAEAIARRRARSASAHGIAEMWCAGVRPMRPDHGGGPAALRPE
jgi:hypothetical protein